MDIRRIYTVTDLHFGIRNNSIIWKDMMVDFFDWFILDIKKNGFDPSQDVLFILGDVFNSRESINLMILDSVIALFDKLGKEFKNGIHVIVGNHDVYYIDNNNITSVSIMDRMLGHINGYYEPKQLQISGKKCLILPWITSFDEIQRIISEDDSDYLFCHMDINEMKYASGTSIEKSVSKELLKKYKHVFSGHIHIRQTNDNVTYFGTPYQLDSGDSDNIKGYHYIDTKDDFKLHFVENTISPKFKFLNIYKILNSTIDELKELIDNCYVDVICDRTSYEIIDLITFRKKLLDIGINYIKMEFTRSDEVTEDTNIEIPMSNFMFDIRDSSVGLLKNNKKTDSEISIIMEYFDYLYKKVKINNNEE